MNREHEWRYHADCQLVKPNESCHNIVTDQRIESDIVCSQMGSRWRQEPVWCFHRTAASEGGSLLDVITDQKLVTTRTGVMFTEMVASESELEPAWCDHRSIARAGVMCPQNGSPMNATTAGRIMTEPFADRNKCTCPSGRAISQTAVSVPPPRGGACMSSAYWWTSTLHLEMESAEQRTSWDLNHVSDCQFATTHHYGHRCCCFQRKPTGRCGRRRWSVLYGLTENVCRLYRGRIA